MCVELAVRAFPARSASRTHLGTAPACRAVSLAALEHDRRRWFLPSQWPSWRARLFAPQPVGLSHQDLYGLALHYAGITCFLPQYGQAVSFNSVGLRDNRESEADRATAVRVLVLRQLAEWTYWRAGLSLRGFLDLPRVLSDRPAVTPPSRSALAAVVERIPPTTLAAMNHQTGDESCRSSRHNGSVLAVQ